MPLVACGRAARPQGATIYANAITGRGWDDWDEGV
jgi:hypothetical protein